ncbi:hypothetical protein QBC37DRAFT_429278 [Rhypophila decipiens]|uniref:DUF1993 domain-containing protein n=1 Tax=Rhypophila decipiens TaxID=261697 RepID=A0AAN6Y025_9PEZI|nr:hypothetical protein QBC37DRAFT_429278 [Rhypophila decipiens]
MLRPRIFIPARSCRTALIPPPFAHIATALSREHNYRPWSGTKSPPNRIQGIHTKPPSTKTGLPNPSMAPITAFDVSIDLQLRGLRSLKGLLAKTPSLCEADSASLPSAKSPHDPATLAFHITSCTHLATSSVALLLPTEGAEPPVMADKKESTLAELITHVDETIALLEAKIGHMGGSDLDGVEDRELSVTYGNGQTASWGGKEYILGYIAPNFMFHLSMAFSAIRGTGVDVGKMDFLVPFMVGRAPGF